MEDKRHRYLRSILYLEITTGLLSEVEATFRSLLIIKYLEDLEDIKK